jgi:hypothetical protein
MIRSVKAAFGLSLLAALVFSAMSVMSASAITSGHFTSDAVSHLTKVHIVEGTETPHKTTLSAIGTTVECHQVHYEAPNLAGTTFVAITVLAEYTNCTQGGNAASVTMNGCHYIFTPRTPPGHATPHFKCPAGKRAEVHTSAGTLSFGEQTPTQGGVTYTTTTENTKHALTVNITAEGIHYTCHGACQIFGTSGTTGKLTGSVTVQGTDAVNKGYVNITHT